MKNLFTILFFLLIMTESVYNQGKNYWEDAPVNGNRIFYICFTDTLNGYAISAENEKFITSDAGLNWQLLKIIKQHLRKMKIVIGQEKYIVR